jgi:transposase InsO family protein
MCHVLEVSSSGYYAWRQRQPSQGTQADQTLSQQIQAIHGKSKGTYGAPRIHAELADNGVHVGRKRVARLMRAEGLHNYLNLGFRNGFVLDGFEERAFPPDHPQSSPLGWGGRFSEIPPVLVARMRLS